MSKGLRVTEGRRDLRVQRGVGCMSLGRERVVA